MSGDRVERRLAAILEADVAGYSRLIGADEDGSLRALKAIRAELIDPKIAEVSTRRRPASRMRSAAGVTWPPPASSVLLCLTPARAAAAVSIWSPKAASTR